MDHHNQSDDDEQDSTSPLAGNLPVMQAYRPWLLMMALAVMFFVWRRISQQPTSCRRGGSCLLPQSRLGQKIVFWIVAAALFNGLGYPYIEKYFY
jgi:hypothetical protein